MWVIFKDRQGYKKEQNYLLLLLLMFLVALAFLLPLDFGGENPKARSCGRLGRCGSEADPSSVCVRVRTTVRVKTFRGIALQNASQIGPIRVAAKILTLCKEDLHWHHCQDRPLFLYRKWINGWRHCSYATEAKASLQKRIMELLVDVADHDGSKARLDKQRRQRKRGYRHASFCIKQSIACILKGRDTLAYHLSFSIYRFFVKKQEQEEKQKKEQGLAYL